jgi:hypothetical protein
MSVYAANFTLDKGTDFETEFNLTQDDGSPLNLTGYIGAAKIRKHPTASKYNTFDIVFIDRPSGRVKLSIGSSVTSYLSSGRNCYDFFITDATGKVTKIAEGSILVNDSVTLGFADSRNLEGLGSIDITNVGDGYALMYDASVQRYVFVNPDTILSKSTDDDDLPDDFVDLLSQELDDKVDLDAGEF